MKCPICNAENAPDASSCSQCGFSLGLSQATWPDFPTIEMPEPAGMTGWPEPPAIEIPSAPIEVKEEEIKAAAVDTPPPDQPSDDELAREHVARGFEAIRQGMLDQAQWELEQARDLADNEDIFHLAQRQLSELASAAAPTVQRQPAPITPARRPPIKPSPSTLALDQILPAHWVPTARIGLIAGAVNIALTGCGAASCFGFFLSMSVAFVTGVLIARQVGQDQQSLDATHALAAGGVAGLGGWLGQVIGSIAWAAALSNTQSDASAWPFVACLAGIVYIPVATALSALGWKVGMPRQK